MKPVRARSWLAMAGTLALLTVIAAACSSSPSGQSAGTLSSPPTTATTTTTSAPATTATSGVSGGSPSVAAPAGPTTTPPASIAADCSTDVTGALHKWFKSLRAGSTVAFAHDACYTVNGILRINKTTRLTIDGNEAILKQSVAGKNGGTNKTRCDHHPTLFLTENTDLSVQHLRIEGPFNGHNGGVHCEARDGVELQGDSTVTLNYVSVSNIQGDGLALDPNYVVKKRSPLRNNLNTNVTVANSSWDNMGYMCVSMEAVDHATIETDTFANCHEDAVDFEYDTYSTADHNGQPAFAAQDNVTFTHDNFDGWAFDWFTSQQGQRPGVQQQNIVFEDNTLSNGNALVQVRGTGPAKTTPFYENVGLSFIDNKATAPGHSTSGGSPTRAFVGSAMTIKNVTNVTITGNTFPVYDGTARIFPNHPFLAALEANRVMGLSLTSNDFSGALGIFRPTSKHNTNVTQCGNRYGANGSMSDGSCK